MSSGVAAGTENNVASRYRPERRVCMERELSWVLKNSVLKTRFPSGEFPPVGVFLAVVCFLRGCHRWLHSPVEEPHQSFQVLCHGSQVELLPHELDSA
jgi:hypothetical protein